MLKEITRRHVSYISVCEYIAIAKRADVYKLPSSRRIAAVLNISHVCVHRHLQELMKFGWVRRIENGNAWRSITYNITLTKEEASNFIEFIASSPTRKKKRRMLHVYPKSNIGENFTKWRRG